MGRYKRVFMVFSGLIALLIVVALLALKFLPETEFIRINVQDHLRRITGQQVSVGSISVSPSYTGVLNLKVRGIAVASEQGKLLLSADELILSPEIIPFFRKEISVESVTVRGLRATVRRSHDGTITTAFIPMPVSSPPPEGGARPESGTKPEVVPESDLKPDKQVKWSIDSVYLKDSRIDWVDQHALPGQDVQVSLKNLSATLVRTKPDRKVSVKAVAELCCGSGKPRPVEAHGTVIPAADLNGLDGAVIDFTANSISLKPLDVYLPPWLNSDMNVESVAASLNWDKGSEAKIRLSTALKSEARTAAQLNVRADLVAADGFSEIESVRVNAETDGFPLSFLTSSLPEKIPLDTRSGILKATIQANWKKGRNWSADANLNLEDLVPAGNLKGLASKVRIWTQAKLEPDLLLIESMEISESNRIASLSGSLTCPFSDERLLDLQGEFSFRPEWLKNFGMSLPKGFTVSGAIPVRGNVRGKTESVWIDLKADLTATELHWSPHFEKAHGNKGLIAIRGNFLPFKEQKNVEPAIISLGMAGVNLRVNPKGKWLPGKYLSLESKIFLKGNKVDFKEGILTLRRGSEPGDILSVRADLTDVGSPAPNFDGTGTLILDGEIVSLLSGNQSDVTLKGSAPLKAKVSGTSAALTWSMAVPLTHLDVAVGRSFRKPGGLAGAFKASGKSAGQELELSSAQLTLPGVVLNGKGKLRDRNGHFGEIQLDLAKSELKELLKLIPSDGDLKLSGPLEASIVLKKPAEEIDLHGVVRLLSVDYRPPNAGWTVENIKGLIEPRGNSVEIPELAGSIRGAIEAPVKVKGSLKDVRSSESVHGNLSVTMDAGKIRADRLRNTLDKVSLLIGTILEPQKQAQKSKLLEFKSLTADLKIAGGNVRTDNLCLKGEEVNAGLIGSARLSPMNLDLLAGIKTYTVAGSALGKIPAVKELVKKHEDLLKITGLDKELKRLGIEGGSEGTKPEASTQPAKTPVTVILKVRGPASNPEVSPVLENTLSKEVLSRLQGLMN
ncbi:MAG: DUF748 domain-containing protein [Desulfomonile tiedjei]|uniref:DUF748 domain-containing protein n=1 Tax=Desulfomonile tiedjei TaxID=2358 RepID=A0A9D6V2R3_9BACT|nr:DUF748 domain-containing protein [Desulfomonile tiedjei]